MNARAFPLALPLLLSLLSFAQTPTSSTFRGSTSLVVVDVVVTDKNGNPVPNLEAADFTLSEQKVPQTIRNFDRHMEADRLSSPISAVPGIVTNEVAGPASGPADVLLIDALNTPDGSSQIYLRDQLVAYLKHAPASRRIAIFALGSELRLLQTFTTNPALLSAAIARSGKLHDTGTAASGNRMADQTSVQQYENANESAPNATQAAQIENLQIILKDMEARRKSVATQVRIRDTLDALNQIARYLAGVSGRKNLVWFSGSFPLIIMRDVSETGDPFAGSADLSPLFKKTVDLLATSQVSVYPIDARGLQTPPSATRVTDPDAYFVGNVSRMANSTGSISLMPEDTLFAKSNAEEHATMEQIADATGGAAFFNTNNLTEAVETSLHQGATYYTLSYTSSDTRADGHFRTIQISAHKSGLHLAYRRGYYADRPLSGAVSSPTESQTLPAALRWNSPLSTQILFSVRALPARQTAAASTSSKSRIKEPAHHYTASFGVDPRSLAFTATPDGHFHAALEFASVVFDSTGKQLDSHADRVNLDLDSTRYAAIMKSGIGYQQQITLPSEGDPSLRLAVHDATTDRLGTLDLSSAALSRSLEAATTPSH